MTKTKIWEVYCDTCSQGIVHLSSVSQINKAVKEWGGFVRGDKHYCSKECLPPKGDGTK